VLGRERPLPRDQFAFVVQVKFIGKFNVIRLATEAMVEANSLDGERVIVNTASAAFDGQIGQAACSASKGGVVGMMLSLAHDLGDKHIRVITLATGCPPRRCSPACLRRRRTPSAGSSRTPVASVAPASSPRWFATSSAKSSGSTALRMAPADA
jgi:NAD(P)-dependent dehydrogenase (short-subunit alcohol dehydrogenase family)